MTGIPFNSSFLLKIKIMKTQIVGRHLDSFECLGIFFRPFDCFHLYVDDF